MDPSQDARTRELIGLFLRISLGLLFFFAGLNKLLGGIQTFSGYLVNEFGPTWLPKFLLYPFAYILPWVELIGGFSLIVGFMTRRFLFIMGCVLLILEFGKAVQGDHETVARIANYILILGAALWTIREDPYSLDGLRRGM